mmetsp:Transcript_43381/g.69513  ORF Transcript_43381/g.69513 Transcript_43381/m.69513 type:complete len:99 (-) Transcript_43381:159-455(-)
MSIKTFLAVAMLIVLSLIGLASSSGGVCYWSVPQNLGSISVPGKTHQWCQIDLNGTYAKVQTVGASSGCTCTLKNASHITMYCPDSDYGGSATCIPVV